MHDLFDVPGNHKMFKPQRSRIKNQQFAVYISDTHMTLKQGQDQQTQNDNVDLKQG